MKNYFTLLRPQQWLKNLFVLAPLFFSGHLFELDRLFPCLLGMIAFSLNASSVYIFNDYRDVDKDKLHPAKRFRPLAAGSVPKNNALILFVLLSVVAFAFAYKISNMFCVTLAIYYALNIAYSMGLKALSLIDIFIVSSGFVFRVIGGGIICNIEISHWLFIMTFLLALFIALAKRRDDVLIELRSGEKMRHSISGYTLEFGLLSRICGYNLNVLRWKLHAINELQRY